METVTLPPQSFNSVGEIAQEKNKNNENLQKCKVTLDAQNMKTIAKIAGSVAALFVFLQIAGILYQIFILEQRLLSSGEKGGCFLMIFFSVLKIAYRGNFILKQYKIIIIINN